MPFLILVLIVIALVMIWALPFIYHNILKRIVQSKNRVKDVNTTIKQKEKK